MNNETIIQFVEDEFSKIQHDEDLEQFQKDMLTAKLMTMLEDYMYLLVGSYELSAYQNSHPDIIELYEKLSSSRKSL